MKEINKRYICYYCLGCMKLEDENFSGVMNCRNLVAGYKNWEKMWRKELKKSEQVQK